MSDAEVAHVEQALTRDTLIFTRSEYELVAKAFLRDHELLLRALAAAESLGATGERLLAELKQSEQELYRLRFSDAP